MLGASLVKSGCPITRSAGCPSAIAVADGQPRTRLLLESATQSRPLGVTAMPIGPRSVAAPRPPAFAARRPPFRRARVDGTPRLLARWIADRLAALDAREPGVELEA